MTRNRIGYVVAPLLFLLLAIWLINLIFPAIPLQNNVNSTVAAGLELETPLPIVPTRPPILPATILPSPVPSPMPLPSSQLSATIALVGPPPNSSFLTTQAGAFYWTYSERLQPGQHFVLILLQNGQTHRLATLSHPTIGDVYHVQADFDPLSSGPVVWQIRLEGGPAQGVLLAGEERTLILIDTIN